MAAHFYILEGGQEGDEWYYGRVRIFVNNEFKEPELNVEYKHERDMQAIRESFGKLHFKVDEPIMNKTAKEMIACLTDIDIDYFGCAVIFVFSHGEQDFIYGTDYDKNNGKGKLNVLDDLCHNFSGHNKSDLKKCPKVFFNECCQLLGSSKQQNASCQNTAHWLIFNAALPGYTNFFHQDNGSYSIQAICQRLNDYAELKDLKEILDLVIGDVGKIKIQDENNSDLFMQPVQFSTLQKKLYLLPEDRVYELLSIYRKEFRHLDVLGSGAFGVVFKAKNIEDEMEYAIKRIQLKNKSQSEQKKIKSEIKSLAQLSQCPQIVGYHRVWYEAIEFDCQLKQDRQLQIKGALIETDSIINLCYIQMELCGESLDKWLKKKSDRKKVESLKIFNQIIQGLSFIHEKGVVHRDVKPGNILFARTDKDSDLHVRIVDFGLSRHLNSFTATAHCAGTLLYLAPEMLRGKFEPKSDMYSAGLILLELLYNCSEDLENILNNAKDNQFPPSFENTMKFAVPILKRLLSFHKNDRPSSNELLKILGTNLDWNEELQSATRQQREQCLSKTEDSKLVDVSSKEEWQFESVCSIEQHSLQGVDQWTVVETLSWDGEWGGSPWYLLKAAASTNTRWQVLFGHRSDDDFGVWVRCVSLDEQFRAAAVRLVAMLEGDARVWGEAAAVLKSGNVGRWWCPLSKKVMEYSKVRPIKVRLTVQWTELERLPPTPVLWMESTVRIQCSWQLRGWNAVTPTTRWWSLWSQPFNWSGALWRIVVVHKRSDGKIKLDVGVCLQHLPVSVDWSRICWKCSITVWSEKMDEQEKNMEEGLYCDWTVLDDLEVETRDPLNLVVIIYVSKNSDTPTAAKTDTTQLQ